MTVMMSKQGLQLNTGFKPWGEAWYFSHSHDYVYGRTERFNPWEEKFTHADLTCDQTWCCLHNNPVLRSDHQIPTFQHTVPPAVFQKLVCQQCLKYLCIRTVNKATKMTSLILNKFKTMIFFLKLMGSRDNTAQGILHDAAHRLYQCFFTFKMSYSFTGHS